MLTLLYARLEVDVCVCVCVCIEASDPLVFPRMEDYREQRRLANVS